MAQQDAISVLKTDHQRVRELFSRCSESSGGSEQAAILEELAGEIQRHTRLEEQLFYPAFRKAAEGSSDESLYFESVEEHHVVDLVLPEVKKETPGTLAFSAKVKVLQDIVGHHLEEEEQTLFPKVRELMSAGALQDLGQQITERKQELMGAAPEGSAGGAGIDINEASAEELTRIEGIDGARAQRIVAYRDQNGRFASWDNLTEVEGIDGGMVARIREEGRLGR